MDFEGKRVTVMGLGLHGGAVGTVRWLAEQGADITVTDMKSRRQLGASIDALRDLENVRFVLGEHRTVPTAPPCSPKPITVTRLPSKSI